MSVTSSLGAPLSHGNMQSCALQHMGTAHPNVSGTSVGDTPEGDTTIESIVARFLSCDDDLKAARVKNRETRRELAIHRRRVLDFMRSNKIDRLSGIKGNTQYLEAVKRSIRIRPTSEQMQRKLQELLAAGIKDAEHILRAVRECGGTREEMRLSRRTRRVSAVSIAGVLATVASLGITLPIDGGRTPSSDNPMQQHNTTDDTSTSSTAVIPASNAIPGGGTVVQGDRVVGAQMRRRGPIQKRRAASTSRIV